MFNLTGKVALVAGGAGYLGSPVCRGLFEHGAHVVVADLDRQRAEDLARELQGTDSTRKSLGLPLDIRAEESMDEVLARVRADLGPLDVLVNLAYAPHGAPIEQITARDFTAALGGNVTGAFLLARRAKQAMTRGGSMVFFSSMYGRVAPDPRMYPKPLTPNPIEYGVSKAAIEQMVRYLAVAWAPAGIRVNGVAPGAFPHPGTHPEFMRHLAAKTPLGRGGQADEVAGPVVFLCSDAASYLTGQTLPIDGGWTAW